MEKKKEDIILIFAIVVLLTATGGLILEEAGITGMDVVSTSSQVAIQGYYAISASNGLSGGIDFGNVNTLPSYHTNATYNYNSSNNDKTEYYITVSSASNVNVDFCVKANTDLRTSGGDVIGLGNFTWEDDTTDSATVPAVYGSSLTTSYITGSTGIIPGNDNYYRFWLNISASQAVGTYNNTVYFQGVQQGTSCN